MATFTPKTQRELRTRLRGRRAYVIYGGVEIDVSHADACRMFGFAQGAGTDLYTWQDGVMDSRIQIIVRTGA